MDKTKAKLAVLFFDLRGWYKAQEGKDAGGMAADLDSFYNEVIDSAGVHKGRVVKFMGDAGLLVFERVADAVSFARHVVKSRPANVGIEAGEVVSGTFGKEPHQWFDVIGPAVNEAAKNMGRAAKSESASIMLGPQAWQELEEAEREGLSCSS